WVSRYRLLLLEDKSGFPRKAAMNLFLCPAFIFLSSYLLIFLSSYLLIFLSSYLLIFYTDVYSGFYRKLLYTPV
ncbi:hypothetical protein, partial [Vibrio chagasii]|uniref:hypothetical protein n=1 Tax=Vibrio chagasii TaxID=170679 RepID=UPI0040694553